MGLGAAKVFEDNKVSPITGHLLVFSNPNKCRYVINTKFGD